MSASYPAAKLDMPMLVPQSVGSTRLAERVDVVSDLLTSLYLVSPRSARDWMEAAAPAMCHALSLLVGPNPGLYSVWLLAMHTPDPSNPPGIYCKPVMCMNGKRHFAGLMSLIETMPRSTLAELGWGRGSPRSAGIADARWGPSPERHSRLALGLDEFVRSAMPVRGPGQPAVLIAQIDVQKDAPPGLLDAATSVLAFASEHLQRAYNFHVSEPLRRQQAVLDRISKTQQDVVRLLVEGLTEREIAQQLHRSPHTVHDHVKTIYAALGVRSRFELLSMWTFGHAVIDQGGGHGGGDNGD